MKCSVLSSCMTTMWPQLPRTYTILTLLVHPPTHKTIKEGKVQKLNSLRNRVKGKMDATGAGVSMQQEQPVVVDAEKKKMNVLVAVDESEGSLYALKWALENLVNGVSRSSEPGVESGMITVAHVQEPFKYQVYPVGPGGAALFATPTIVESARKAQAENSAAILSRALKICKDKMIKAETLVLEGDPKDMICQATELMHFDLLVLGSRGLGRIKRAFLGSVSDYCAHHASCPILIVKPPKA